eukprot:GHUV01023037.1.p1 GENE.GHUV01023037.1~~GHUV01023037.1.p1  ORF type:complete len:129 (-),score=25.77 GHUV01023037.1:31-417(-)
MPVGCVTSVSSSWWRVLPEAVRYPRVTALSKKIVYWVLGIGALAAVSCTARRTRLRSRWIRGGESQMQQHIYGRVSLTRFVFLFPADGYAELVMLLGVHEWYQPCSSTAAAAAAAGDGQSIFCFGSSA